MIIDKVIFKLYQGRTEEAIDCILKRELDDACKRFTNSKLETVVEDTKILAIVQHIARSNYATGIKIQKFIDNAIQNDFIKLTDDIKDFIKHFNKDMK